MWHLQSGFMSAHPFVRHTLTVKIMKYVLHPMTETCF